MSKNSRGRTSLFPLGAPLGPGEGIRLSLAGSDLRLLVFGLLDPARWRLRWHATKVLQWRDLRAIVFGPGMYVALAMGAVAALIIVSNDLDAIASSHILILSDAFSMPFFASATIAMFYLALASVTAVAREKDQGTLEVLFYGPVDHCAYILSKHLAQVVVYLGMS